MFSKIKNISQDSLYTVLEFAGQTKRQTGPARASEMQTNLVCYLHQKF